MSTSSLIGIIFSLILSIGLPIFLFVFWRKRRRIDILPMIVGVIVFVLFVLILESLLHNFIFSQFPVVLQNPILYVTYGCLAAGLFEEVGRFIGYKVLSRTQQINRVETALSYGVGHGGIESIVIVGLTMISNLIVGIAVKGQGAQAILSVLPEETREATAQQLSLLAGPNGLLFAVSGIERIFAITLHIMLSVLVWMVVTKKLPFPFLLISILLHAVSNVGAALYQVEIFSLAAAEIYTGALTVAVSIFVLTIYNKRGKQLRMNLIS